MPKIAVVPAAPHGTFLLLPLQKGEAHFILFLTAQQKGRKPHARILPWGKQGVCVENVRCAAGGENIQSEFYP